jgi:hypothetical protein
MKMAGGELREMAVGVGGVGAVNRTRSELKSPITLLVKLLYPEDPVPTLAQTWIIFIRLKWAIFSECPTYVCSSPLNASDCKPENTLHRRRVILTQNGGAPNLGARAVVKSGSSFA